MGALAMVLVAALAGCGDSGAAGPPVGVPVLPDLVPDPPLELRTRDDGQGHIQMLFTSTLTNVGAGDFILRGMRDLQDWRVDQEIVYSESGVEVIPTETAMEYGGDGHGHWHVARVAVYWLEAIDESGRAVAGFERRYDTKVGFCFYDSHHFLDWGPEDRSYEAEGCAEEDDSDFRVGLSRGWSDVYAFFVPGQEVDITGLPDGMYRLWGEADPEGWFREASRDNNLTWVDVELGTSDFDGSRLARVVDAAPLPGDL
jgi:hypothetical protein